MILLLLLAAGGEYPVIEYRSAETGEYQIIEYQSAEQEEKQQPVRQPYIIYELVKHKRTGKWWARDRHNNWQVYKNGRWVKYTRPQPVVVRKQITRRFL